MSTEANYTAISTEIINIGRSEATSVSALPTATNYITWKMDLNTATMYIRPPEQKDLTETHMKAGIDQFSIVCNINTDNYTKEIEITGLETFTSTTDVTGGVLSYSIPAVSGESAIVVTSGITAGSVQDRLNAIALQLRVNSNLTISKLLAGDNAFTTIAVVYVTTASSGVINSLMKAPSTLPVGTTLSDYSSAAQDTAITGFMYNLKLRPFSPTSTSWYNTNVNNLEAVQFQIKKALCSLFDKNEQLNLLLGSTVTSSVFVDTAKIITVMKSDSWVSKFFSQQQLREVLDAANDNGRTLVVGEVKSFNFMEGDSISALVYIVDNDTVSSVTPNKDLWMVTLEHVEP